MNASAVQQLPFLCLLIHLSSWSVSYCSHRTLASVTEANLIVLAMHRLISSNIHILKEERSGQSSNSLRAVREGDDVRPVTVNSLELELPLAAYDWITVALVTFTVYCRPTAIAFRVSTNFSTYLYGLDLGAYASICLFSI